MSSDSTKAVTTRSLTLRTPLFSFGYTWRQEESDRAPDQVAPEIKCATVSDGLEQETTYTATDTITEAKRRQQIMRLFDQKNSTQEDFPVLDRQKTAIPVNAHQACSYYLRTVEQTTVSHQNRFPSS